MSICTVCHKDSKKHSEKLWEMHKQITKCMFCNKTSDTHSEKLWELHEGTVENARRKTHHKKLWTMQIGQGRACPALLDNAFNSNSDMNPVEWLIPIYMSCSNTECGLCLGDMESDYADILDGMCLKCFREETGQTDIWYDTPSVLKKEDVNC